MITRRSGLLALLALSVLAGCGPKSPPVTALPSEATVLALGDSLTSGVGAKPGEDWPSLLAQSTPWDIINAGISGNTSAQGLARLPMLLQAHSPDLVIVGLGGNDFLRRLPTEQTRNTLTDIVKTIQAANAQVVLVGIPEANLLAAASGSLSDHPMYEAIAQELKVPLIGDIWGPILSDPELRADTVHANAEGYATFAQALEEALRKQGFLQ